jgi:hypothetical protein
LYAPDLDEGVLDVEHYQAPADSGDPYLAEVFRNAQQELDNPQGDDMETAMNILSPN